MPIQKSCEFCERRFATYPSVTKLGNGKFCSRKCAARSREGHAPLKAIEARRGKKAHNFAGVEIACANCGEKFVVAPCRLRRKYPIKCCSQACSYQLKRTRKPSGYRRSAVDGKSTADHIVLAEKAFGREAIFGKHVHHIDGYRLNNSPSNLIVLKAGQHRSIHDFQWRHGCQFTAEIILKLLPDALWLGGIVPLPAS